MNNIAHPNLNSEQLDLIEAELIKDEESLQKLWDEIGLRRLFFDATKVCIILQNQLPQTKLRFYFDYIRNSDENTFSFIKLMVFDGEKEITRTSDSLKLRHNLFPFMEQLENEFFSPSKQNYEFINNESGRKEFLKKLLENDYELWQHSYLQQDLSEKITPPKKLKI